MKKHKTKFLLTASVRTLREIIEFEGNDIVQWHPLKNTKADGENYFHEIITCENDLHISAFTPGADLHIKARNHFTKGLNFIQLSAKHAINEEMFTATKPFIEAALSADLTLLGEGLNKSLSPLALALTHHNLRMLKYFLETIEKYQSSLTPLQFADLYHIDKDEGKQSLYEYALTVTGITEELLNVLKKRGVHLFSRNTQITGEDSPEFETPDSFTKAFSGEGSSTSLTLSGSKEYWIACLKALQKHHQNSFLNSRKYATLEESLTGHVMLPDPTDDLEMVSQLIFATKMQNTIIKEILADYDRSNPVKTLSRKMINLEQEDPERHKKSTKHLALALAAIEITGFVIYVLYLTTLYKTLDSKRDELKDNYPQCFSKERKNELEDQGFYIPVICFPAREQWLCTDETETWYDRYVRDYKDCQNAYWRASDFVALGTFLYVTTLLTVVIHLPLTIKGAKSYLRHYSALLKLPFRVANKICGEYNQETITYDKQRYVHNLIQALETFQVLFDGIEKEAIGNTVKMLEKPLDEITVQEILSSGEGFLSLLGHYSTHIKFLPASSRVSINDLKTVLNSFDPNRTSTVTHAVKSPLLPKYQGGGSKIINMDIDKKQIDEEANLPDENTSLLRNSRTKTRCVII